MRHIVVLALAPSPSIALLWFAACGGSVSDTRSDDAAAPETAAHAPDVTTPTSGDASRDDAALGFGDEPLLDFGDATTGGVTPAGPPGSGGTPQPLDAGGDAALRGYDTDGSCGPTTCPYGCCHGASFCVFPPGPPTYCGGHGNACVACPDGGYYPDAACSPANCPAGCCDGNGFCVDPPTGDQCGTQGAVCAACPAGGSCLGGTCIWPVTNCGPSNCSGCCNDTPDGSDQCFAGTFALLCGHGGGNCTACGPNEQCRAFGFDGGGYCQANTGCDPSSCTGCCVGDICAQGNQHQACGYGGVACVNCGCMGSCYNGRCTVGGPLVQDAACD